MSERVRLVIAGAVALVVAVFVLSRAMHGGAPDTSGNASASSAPSSRVTAAPQGGGSGVGASSSSPASDPLVDGISPALKGQAADEAVIRTVVPRWGQFRAEWSQDKSSWLDTFESSPNVATSFVKQSREQFFELWTGAMQQGVDVTGCEILSVKKTSDSAGARTYAVKTKSTMKSSDSAGGRIAAQYEQDWDFKISDNDSAPQLVGFTIKTK